MYNKRSFGLAPRTFGYFLDDMLHNGGAHLQEEMGSLTTPVNVLETEKDYEIHVSAPGLKKEDFKIAIDKNILTVSYDHKEEANQHEGKWISKEFRKKSFKRSFTLNEKIDSGKIAAKYADGILTIALPKKEVAETVVHEVAVN